MTTDRLVLRPLAVDDLGALAPLHAEESFWKYPFGRGWSQGETEAFLERTVQRYDDPGMAVSAIVVAETGELAGWAGLSIPTFLPEVLPAVEVGWRLGERFRGKGYATEAGAAWVRHGFDALSLDSLVSIYEPDNIASGVVMQRLGFAFVREATHPTYNVSVHVMALSRDAWLATAERAPDFEHEQTPQGFLFAAQ